MLGIIIGLFICRIHYILLNYKIAIAFILSEAIVAQRHSVDLNLAVVRSIDNSAESIIFTLSF